MNLSHDIFPRILPHKNSWLNIYGTSVILLYKFFSPSFTNLANLTRALFFSLFSFLVQGRVFFSGMALGPSLLLQSWSLSKKYLTTKKKLTGKRKQKATWKSHFGDGLLTSDGEKWAKQRKLANHASMHRVWKYAFSSITVFVHFVFGLWFWWLYISNNKYSFLGGLQAAAHSIS